MHQSDCCFKKGMAAAEAVLATDMTSVAATLPSCDVRDSFDRGIILLWQRHNLSHHIKSFSSLSIPPSTRSLSHEDQWHDSSGLDYSATHTQHNGPTAKHSGGGGSVSHQSSHLALTHWWVAATRCSILTLYFLHSYSHVHTLSHRRLPASRLVGGVLLAVVSTRGQEEVLHVSIVVRRRAHNNLLLA